jgi:hypothetical protein
MPRYLICALAALVLLFVAGPAPAEVMEPGYHNFVGMVVDPATGWSGKFGYVDGLGPIDWIEGCPTDPGSYLDSNKWIYDLEEPGYADVNIFVDRIFSHELGEYITEPAYDLKLNGEVLPFSARYEQSMLGLERWETSMWYYDIPLDAGQNIFTVEASSLAHASVWEEIYGTDYFLSYDMYRNDDQAAFSNVTAERKFTHSEFYNGDYPAPVPVPGAVWLLGSGLAALTGLRRKLRMGLNG